MNWYLQVLRKYAVFTGRARRKEYWFFFLFNVIFLFILGLIDTLTGTANPNTGLGLLSGIYWLAVLIPSIAVAVRRMHEDRKSTRLNSSHVAISYAVFCLKKKI